MLFQRAPNGVERGGALHLWQAACLHRAPRRRHLCSLRCLLLLLLLLRARLAMLPLLKPDLLLVLVVLLVLPGQLLRWRRPVVGVLRMLRLVLGSVVVRRWVVRRAVRVEVPTLLMPLLLLLLRPVLQLAAGPEGGLTWRLRALERGGRRVRHILLPKLLPALALPLRPRQRRRQRRRGRLDAHLCAGRLPN